MQLNLTLNESVSVLFVAMTKQQRPGSATSQLLCSSVTRCNLLLFEIAPAYYWAVDCCFCLSPASSAALMSPLGTRIAGEPYAAHSAAGKPLCTDKQPTP